jgi:oxygen-dependent protoporphyrinogen oxidase
VISANEAGKLPVAILGAGLAGLAAATELRRHGVRVVVYEAGKQVAGLARSHRDSDGFSYDTGAHFITNRLAAAIGVSAGCRDVRYYGESVWLNGRAVRYPIGLITRPRFVGSALKARFAAWRGAAPPVTAADWFRAHYGQALADEVAIPLVEAWSGLPASALAPSVGEKMNHGMLRTLWLLAAARLTRRAVANGYSREKPEGIRVWHVYPEGGLSLLCQHLADPLVEVIRLETPVEKILVESGRVVAIRAGGREQPVAAVVSTAPVNVLPRLIEGSEVLAALARFKYRAMICVNLRLEGRRLLPDVVLWTPQDRFPFFRVTEATQSMPWLAPPGKTLITVDIGAEIGDSAWVMPDDQLEALCLEQLEPIVAGIRRRSLGSRVLRVPLAYPVFALANEAARQALAVSTGIDGLLSIGRNGEFGHWLMEDVYWRTLGKIRAWLAGQAGSGRDRSRVHQTELVVLGSE